MSIALEHQWRWDISCQLHELALDAADRLGDGGARAALLRNLGEALRDGGSDVGRAAECFSESIALFHSSGDAHGESDALGNLGILQRQQGELQKAARTLTAAESLFRALPLERGLAWTLREKAVISRHHAHYSEALAQLDQSQALFAANEETRGVGWTLRTRADTEKESTVGGCPLPRRWYTGPWPGRPITSRPAQDPRWAAAHTHYEHAAQLLHAVQDHRGHTWTTLGLADMALHEGDPTAAELISRALQETDACGDHRGHSRALTLQALLYAEAHRLSDAITLAEQALTGPRDHVGAAQTSFLLARLYSAAGRQQDVPTPSRSPEPITAPPACPSPILPTPSSAGHSTAARPAPIASAAISDPCGLTIRMRNPPRSAERTRLVRRSLLPIETLPGRTRVRRWSACPRTGSVVSFTGPRLARAGLSGFDAAATARTARPRSTGSVRREVISIAPQPLSAALLATAPT
ncbi:tetratricopeptide repeat protein [Streptomyces sp. NPDC001617]